MRVGVRVAHVPFVGVGAVAQQGSSAIEQLGTVHTASPCAGIPARACLEEGGVRCVAHVAEDGQFDVCRSDVRIIVASDNIQEGTVLERVQDRVEGAEPCAYSSSDRSFRSCRSVACQSVCWGAAVRQACARGRGENRRVHVRRAASRGHWRKVVAAHCLVGN